MPLNRFISLFFSLPMLSPADAPGGGDPTPDSDPKDDPKSDDLDRDDPEDKLGDPGKEALKREREARKAAEKTARDTAKRLADLEKAQKDREEAEATQKGEWESIAKKREEELEDLRKQLTQRDTTERRATIAKKHGIPDDLVSLLQGETDDDIEASAKIVAKHVKQREAPETDAGERTPPGTKKTESKKKEADFSSPSYWGLRQR